MDLTGSRILPAPRTEVWAHLIAPDSLARCIPGCERVTGNPVDGFDMVVSQNLVLTKVTFEGTIELSDVVPATSVTLTGRGKGGVAGHAKGSAGIRLDDHPVGTDRFSGGGPGGVGLRRGHGGDGRDVLHRSHRFGLEVEHRDGDDREEQTESEDDDRAAEDPAVGAAGHGRRV